VPKRSLLGLRPDQLNAVSGGSAEDIYKSRGGRYAAKAFTTTVDHLSPTPFKDSDGPWKTYGKAMLNAPGLAIGGVALMGGAIVGGAQDLADGLIGDDDPYDWKK